MILNINGHRVNGKYIVSYRKRIVVEAGVAVVDIEVNNSTIVVDCFGSEGVVDAILSLIDDAFENEINLVYINAENIKGNLERAYKDAFQFNNQG